MFAGICIIERRVPFNRFFEIRRLKARSISNFRRQINPEFLWLTVIDIAIADSEAN